MEKVVVIGCGILTPLGDSPTMVKAVLSAGVNAYQESQLLGEGEPTIKFSPVPDEALSVKLPGLLSGLSVSQIRLLKIAATALANIAPQLPAESLPLFLAGPEPYYPQRGVNPTFIQQLIKSSAVTLDFANSRYIGTGRSGGIAAIEAAFTYLKTSGAHYALVGGVDTYHDMRTLGILAEQGRLLGSNDSGELGVEGFVPSEAAAFLLIASPNAPLAALSRRQLLTLHQPALVYETGHLLSDNTYSAEAMSNAVRLATSSIELPVETLYSSETGELHYAKEITIARLRNQHKLAPAFKIIRPAEFLGDVGAAFALLAISLETVEPRTASLVCASSDGGFRGAIYVSPS